MRRLLAVLMITLCVAAARAEDTFVAVTPGIESIPGPGQTLRSDQTAIHIRLSGSAMTASTPRVWLDGKDVTALVIREENRLSLPLPDVMAPGEHMVRVMVPTLTGARDASWTVNVAGTPPPPPAGARLQLVTNAGAQTLYEGDELKVTVLGPPGGRGVADVAGHFKMPLVEGPPGTYSARHEITHSDYVLGGKLVASVGFSNGTVLTASVPTPIKIFGQMFTVRIQEPVNGTTVPWNFKIRGRTRPGALVTLSPSLGGPPRQPTLMGGAPPQVGATQDNLGSIQVTADSRGYFETSFGFPLHIVAVRYFFMVTALTADGAQAIPATFSVRLADKQRVEEEKKKTQGPSRNN